MLTIAEARKKRSWKKTDVSVSTVAIWLFVCLFVLGTDKESP